MDLDFDFGIVRGVATLAFDDDEMQAFVSSLEVTCSNDDPYTLTRHMRGDFDKALFVFLERQIINLPEVMLSNWWDQELARVQRKELGPRGRVRA